MLPWLQEIVHFNFKCKNGEISDERTVWFEVSTVGWYGYVNNYRGKVGRCFTNRQLDRDLQCPWHSLQTIAASSYFLRQITVGCAQYISKSFHIQREAILQTCIFSHSMGLIWTELNFAAQDIYVLLRRFMQCNDRRYSKWQSGGRESSQQLILYYIVTKGIYRQKINARSPKPLTVGQPSISSGENATGGPQAVASTISWLKKRV